MRRSFRCSSPASRHVSMLPVGPSDTDLWSGLSRPYDASAWMSPPWLSRSDASRFSNSNARMVEASARDLIRTIDVAQVDQHGLGHRLLETGEIKRAELLPFGDDHQRGGALRAVIGVLAEGDVGDIRLRLLHALGIVGAHLRTHVLECRDDRNRRRVAHVVGVGLE